MYPLLIIKSALLAGLACWLSIACFNHIIDPATNRHLLGTMVGMDLLKEDGQMGQGLLPRAWVAKQTAHILLWIVAIIQAIIATMLWVSAILLVKAAFHASYFNLALQVANWSLLGFMMLWLWFLCGGIWFGYWIKMNHVQTTHLLLVVISLLTITVVNMPLAWNN